MCGWPWRLAVRVIRRYTVRRLDTMQVSFREKIMLANYHTHTIRCKHAFGSEREYIETAIEKGLKILGFSDHVPQPYPDGFVSRIRMDMDQIEDYVSTLETLRAEYKDDIRILIGFEVEYTKRFFDPLFAELKEYPVDYLIMGQHFAPDEVDGFYTGAATDEEEKLKAYVDLVTEGMETGLFTYLAHPDLIHYTGDDAVYQNHMRRLISHSIRHNYPLEVNMFGFTDGRHYPCDKFFKMASEMGATFVIGNDAHRPYLIRQPEEDADFAGFLARNGIKCGDNIIALRPI